MTSSSVSAINADYEELDDVISKPRNINNGYHALDLPDVTHALDAPDPPDAPNALDARYELDPLRAPEEFAAPVEAFSNDYEHSRCCGEFASSSV